MKLKCRKKLAPPPLVRLPVTFRSKVFFFCCIAFCIFVRSLKGSKEFQDEQERIFIVSNIKSVNKAILSIDKDRTVCSTIEKIVDEYGNDYRLSFANGGDQNNDTIPEKPICEKF